MASFDYDVVIIGSGFGGSVAALRAAEKGYRVGVMEAGRRWNDEDIPKTNWDLKDYLWFPAAEMYGIQRVEYLDDVLVRQESADLVLALEALERHVVARDFRLPFATRAGAGQIDGRERLVRQVAVAVAGLGQ